MSSPSRQPGRPPGADPETLAKGRLYLALSRYAKPEDIAQDEGVARSEVYRVMKLARAEACAAEQNEPADSVFQAQPSAPRKLSRRTALYRAWELTQQRPVGALGLAANGFWMRLVVAIHEEGDGHCLHLGEHGTRFQTRADLADLFGRRELELEIDDWLEELFRRGRLVDLDGSDIGIPLGLGLAPGENARGQRIAPRSPKRQPANAAQPALPFGLHVVTGGRLASEETAPMASAARRNESGEITRIESGEIRVLPDSESGEMRVSPDISPDSSRLARSVVVDVNVKENQSLNNNINNNITANTPAGESGETVRRNDANGVFSPDSFRVVPPDSESGENTPLASSSSLADVAAQLAGLVKPGRLPNGDEIAVVGSWLTLGTSLRMATDDSLGLIRAVIVNRINACGDDPPNTLKYFNVEVSRALRKAAAGLIDPPETRPARDVPRSVAPALSETDQALKTRLKAPSEAWLRDRSCPFAPSLEVFKQACAVGERTRDYATQWLDCWEAWERAGRPGRLKPPDFTMLTQSRNAFEERMLEIEEALTEPDPANTG